MKWGKSVGLFRTQVSGCRAGVFGFQVEVLGFVSPPVKVSGFGAAGPYLLRMLKRFEGLGLM